MLAHNRALAAHRLLVPLLALSAVGFAVGGCSGTRTAIIFTSPVDNAGRPAPNIKVTAIRQGTCEYGSLVLVSSPLPVYMCTDSHNAYQTCWYTSAFAARPTAICQLVPWSKSVVEVRTPAVPLTPRAGGTKTDLNWPWAVQLTSGQKCAASPGGGQPVAGGGILDYFCGGLALGLLNHADRSTALWTFRTVHRSRRGLYVRGAIVSIAQAWFAGP